MGTSANAVKIQIWTAFIAILILCFLQLRSQFHWSPSALVALLWMNLFAHRNVWPWLNKPFDVLPVPYKSEQLRLNFIRFGKHLYENHGLKKSKMLFKNLARSRGDYQAIHHPLIALIGGSRLNHGLAPSSCAASRKSAASSPKRAAN